MSRKQPNPAPRMHFDRAWRSYTDGESVVVTCSACGLAWASIAFSEDAARSAAERHVVVVHNVQPNRAAQARRLAATRRDAGSCRRPSGTSDAWESSTD